MSSYLVAILAAWCMAHIIKYIVSKVKKEKHGIRSHLFRSGGMPSSHSASVVALASVIGLKDGFGSGLFGLSVLFAMIVMYDAVKVRRSSGEQGDAIHLMIKELKSNIKLPRSAKGHTPLEVFAGAILGLLVGIVVFFATT
ncbi:divergent PAP2 family protein [Candidatus Saccharibacteria bacterium]|nr:divergent PAP2 family protein [Candidatus Saccharibacteria bacterium]